jgi:hypothetical protein
MQGQTKVFGLALVIFAMMASLSSSAYASSLRQGASSAAVSGSLPGQTLWTHYLTADSEGEYCPPGSDLLGDLCNVAGVGDNIIRLVNPNGAANTNLAGATAETVCAMIYIFDSDQEMGECCGCPLSSTQLATFSVEQDLTSNWGIQGPLATSPSGDDNSNGSIAIVATVPNTIGVPAGRFGLGFVNTGGGGPAGQCLGASCCDPTNNPGYIVTTASNMLGSITHNQVVGQPPSGPLTFGITEVALSDDGSGDSTNLIYLQEQCGALVGNGTGAGFCTCPIEQ